MLLSLLVLLLLSCLVLYPKFSRRRSKLNLPPSPPRLPIIGNLHQILGSDLPHHSFQALSNKYGPLMFLHLGCSPTLVVSSAKLAREVMKAHDIVFSNRPKTTAANVFLYGCKDVGFSPYGEYWRQARKTCVLGLLSIKKVQSFQYAREEEVADLANKIRCSCLNGGSVNLTTKLLTASNNIISRCVLGRKAEEETGKSNFGELSRRSMVQFTSFAFGDMFPSLGWLDVVTGLIGRLKATARAFDDLFDQVIEERRTSGSDDKQDLLHVLLQFQKNGRLGIELSDDNLKAILMDMFVGGAETTSTTVEWVMAELVKNPNLMKKAQAEVRNVVKSKLNVSMNDINQMDYLKCVIKETLRFHAPVPLLVPRESSTSLNLRGYDIPAKTTLYINAWAIQRDPKVWSRAEEFLPERFMEESVDVEGQEFQFLPFGVGRRGCPGMAFALATAEYLVANLLYWFDWKLPGGAVEENFDMSEGYGLTVHKRFPLVLMPTPYSPCSI
ncbi:Cytochrome P450 [Melia azedarach]|uniref:Cytochrome P450 n=1 Tax=Melia azedarach TaxID=155640 RepID=A0ACC1XNG6_MELAZ|nr:Cytochrome P450 [Melia azedarach]